MTSVPCTTLGSPMNNGIKSNLKEWRVRKVYNTCNVKNCLIGLIITGVTGDWHSLHAIEFADKQQCEKSIKGTVCW